jgi:hypothetical protein
VAYPHLDSWFTAISKTTNLDEWADELVSVLKSLGAWSRAKESFGTPPDDHLGYIYFGDAGNFDDIRIGWNGSAFILQKGVGGTEGNRDSWATMFTVTTSFGNIATGSGGITLGGTLDCNSKTITNATSVNGVSPTAHASRHQPGGADPLTVGGAPPDITTAGAGGSATSLSRSDHTHRGVKSFSENGSAALYGDVTVSASGQLTATQTGQDVAFTWVHPTINRSFTKCTTTGQAIATAAETAVQWDGTPTVLIDIPGADGAKDYKVSVFLNVLQPAVDTIVRIRRGTSTTPASNTELFQATWGATNIAYFENFTIPCFRVENPAAGQKIMVTIDNDDTDSMAIYGTGDAATKFCYVYIEEEH